MTTPSNEKLHQSEHLVETALERDQTQATLTLLAEHPEAGTLTLAAACVTGNRDAIGAFLDAAPALLNAKTPPKGWEPLLYVCYSCLLRDDTFRPRLIDAARDLIARGTDVNARWPAPEWGTDESALYAAAGIYDCPELAEMLLQAGANPNDGESLYHATELPTPACLHLLMQYGGDIAEHNALAHLLDREEPDWLRMMLSFAHDPARIPPVLLHALRRGRSAECFQILIDAGINLNATETGSGPTPYQAAVRLGRTDVAALLEAAGANTTLSPADRVVGRLARGESVSPSDLSPDLLAVLDAETPTPTLVVLCEQGNLAAVEALLTAGASPHVSDANGWTGLHHAALHGNLALVRVLLRHHADPALRDRAHKSNALGFACYASREMKTAPPEVYVEMVKALLDAGAPVPEVAYGSEAVQAVLVGTGEKLAAGRRGDLRVRPT